MQQDPSNQRAIISGLRNDEEKENSEEQKGHNKGLKDIESLLKTKKQWSELDKYIELLLDSKQTDQSVFVYLNPNANGNPYDLLVVQY